MSWLDARMADPRFQGVYARVARWEERTPSLSRLGNVFGVLRAVGYSNSRLRRIRIRDAKRLAERALAALRTSEAANAPEASQHSFTEGHVVVLPTTIAGALHG